MGYEAKTLPIHKAYLTMFIVITGNREDIKFSLEMGLIDIYNPILKSELLRLCKISSPVRFLCAQPS